MVCVTNKLFLNSPATHDFSHTKFTIYENLNSNKKIKIEPFFTLALKNNVALLFLRLVREKKKMSIYF